MLKITIFFISISDSEVQRQAWCKYESAATMKNLFKLLSYNVSFSQGSRHTNDLDTQYYDKKYYDTWWFLATGYYGQLRYALRKIPDLVLDFYQELNLVNRNLWLKMIILL